MKKVNLDTDADNIDLFSDAVRIVRENEQNLKDIGSLIKRLDILDKIYEKLEAIAKEIEQPITPRLCRRS